jgi:hypothetical protein
VTQAGQFDGPAQVLGPGDYFNSNLTRLRNEPTALRNRQEFQWSQLTKLANSGFESWAKERFEIATKIAYRNGGRIGIRKAAIRTMVAAVPVVPMGYWLMQGALLIEG